MADNGVEIKKVTLRRLREQDYTLTESLRALRTNLQFCGDDIRTILFTSAAPNEGKSTVSFDLACSLCDAKRNVLYIDADIRKSVLVGRLRARTTDGSQIFGLSHFLSGQKSMADVLYETDISRLYMVFSGPSVPNPTEILEKNYFESLVAFGRQHFDYVLIDCPPMGAAIDAAVVARCCDGAILVTAQGGVSSRVVVNVKQQLERSGVHILGAVLNKVDMKKSSYYGKYYGGYYGKYYGQYYGSHEEDKKR